MRVDYRIVVEHLTHSFSGGGSGEPVLSDVSFGVQAGRILAVLGSNGSGKSTLLSCIAKLLLPTGGSAEIRTTSRGELGSAPTVALLHQDYRQTNFPWASTLENVTYPLRFRGVQVHERRRLGGEALHQFLPEVDPAAPAHELSGGQQQLLAIARALVSAPDALLADEPLSAADSVRAMRAVQAVQVSWEAHRFPMVWVSHHVDEALLLGDSIGLLSRRRHGFERFVDNPVPRPRVPGDLARRELAELRAEILAFLLSDNAPLRSGSSVESRALS